MIRIDAAGDGRSVAQVRTPGGAWVRLNSQYAPEAEAGALIDRALGGREVPALVGVIGVGLGYAVDELLRRRPDVRILAIEIVPDLIEPWRSRSDWTEIAARGQLLVVPGVDGELPTPSWPLGVVDEAPLVVEHPVLARAWPDARDRAVRAFEQFVYEQRANADARRRLAALYLRHSIENLPAILESPGADALDGRSRERPLIVCGAGPSLDRLLPALHTARDRAWFVALDTALWPLMAAGLVPDLVVSIDPTAMNGRHLIDLPGRARPWLVAEGSLDPRAIAAFAGRTIFCRIGRADPWPWLEELGVAPPRLRVWGSVLTAACDLAKRMQAPRVIFAGLDLAFTNGQPYCRGTAFEQDWAAEQRRDGLSSIQQVWEARLASNVVDEPDVHGASCRTAPQMIAFRNWVRAFVAASPDQEFVNATGAGILHGPGIAQAELTATLRRSPSVPADRALVGAARPAYGAALPRVREAVDAARRPDGGDGRVFEAWAGSVPGFDAARMRRVLDGAAARLCAEGGGEPMSTNNTGWIDVPYDASNFGAKAPLEWRVGEASVATYAYNVTGKTMNLAFKINFSTLAGAPANELHLRIPGHHLPTRGMANTIWMRSPSGKECGYATVHPGLDLVVLFRATEEVFALEDGEFFLFGQLAFEVQ